MGTSEISKTGQEGKTGYWSDELLTLQMDLLCDIRIRAEAQFPFQSPVFQPRCKRQYMYQLPEVQAYRFFPYLVLQLLLLSTDSVSRIFCIWLGAHWCTSFFFIPVEKRKNRSACRPAYELFLLPSVKQMLTARMGSSVALMGVSIQLSPGKS